MLTRTFRALILSPPYGLLLSLIIIPLSLLIGLILAHARLVKRVAGMAPFLLLDEVAAHLDPNRRAALFAALEDLGTQCFMTGTDPMLFEALGAAAQRVTVREGRLG